MPKNDEKFMAQALRLAAKGGRSVAPNPMVGAVIVKDGIIVGQGYHKEFGGPHAEVLAIESVKDPEDLKGATLYVTLEPCRHYGKTPPCQKLIDEVGIEKVICGSRDPFQARHGKQFHVFLTDETGKKCEELNKFFFTWVKKKRPYITVKIAMSADGFVADPKGQPLRFTSPAQDKRVHQLRAQHQAIMVGSNTVLKDDPHLGVRHVKGPDPLRIVLDSRRRVPKTAQVFRNQNYRRITKKTPLKILMKELAKDGIASLLVEPGPTLYALLKKENLIDELIVLKRTKAIKTGLKIHL
jgi:diaminohydroxyphosphoribosylaminopyrimidine deaminase/5-amino-6-(5-phosphoribosylamino)uracil reductase